MLGNLLLNDSNWQYINNMSKLTSRIPPSNNLQYWTFNNSLGNDTYTYLRYNPALTQFDYNYTQEVPGIALDYYFRPQIFSYAISCTYPISGQYGFLNRLLFYLLLLFALIVRHHSWLAAAALGTAMAYAASAAVHAVALLT